MAKKSGPNYGTSILQGVATSETAKGLEQLTPETRQYFEYKGLNKQFEEARAAQAAEISANNNLHLNSLRGLFLQANSTDFDNPNHSYATSASASMMGRIIGAQSKDELNSVLSDLAKVTDKAHENQSFFGGTLGEALTEGRGGYNAITSKQDYAQKQLKTTNPIFDKDTLEGFDPQDLLNNVKQLIETKRSFLFTQDFINQKGSIQDTEKFLKQAIDSPDKKNALNDLMSFKLKDNFTTVGNDFYREGPEAAKFQKQSLDALRSGTIKSDWWTGMGEEVQGFYKYDIANESINSLRYGLVTKLQQQSVLPKEMQNADEMQSMRNSLTYLDKLQKDASKTYGVDPADRYGAMGAFGNGINDFTNTGSRKLGLRNRNDFEQTIFKKAQYEPEVIATDIDGNPVMSTNFLYTKKDGSIGINGRAITEGGSMMFAQMLPTLSAGSLTGGVLKGLPILLAEAYGASKLIKNLNAAVQSSKALSRAVAVSKSLDLGNRIGTLASVTLSTYPAMLQEEKKWGGDYRTRALGKASIEGFTEMFGVPDFGLIGKTPFIQPLSSGALRAVGAPIPKSIAVKSALSSSYQFGKLALKQNFLEAVEEEMSLLGNAIVDSTLYKDEFNKAGREKTRLSGETIKDTFVDSFAAGLLYSGGTTGLNGYLSTRPNDLQKQAIWEAANNPELYKQKLVQLNKQGVLDDSKLGAALQKVTEYSSALESMVGLSNIRDMRTLLEDKDAQYSYFLNKLRLNDLVKIDYDSLTDDDKNKLAKYKIADKLSTKGRERLDNIKKELAQLNATIQSEQRELTPEEQSRVKELNEEGLILRGANIQALSKNEIADEDINYFKSKGLIKDTDLTFTQEDLNKEIDRLSTLVLETDKRIEKYVGLTKEQKDAIVIESYNEKAKEVQNLTNPTDVVYSRANLQRDLDYLKQKNLYADQAEIEAKESLLNAYGERFNQLVGERDAEGRNQVEREISDADLNSLVATNDIFEIARLEDFTTQNEDFINETLFKTSLNNIQAAKQQAVVSFLVQSEEEKVKTLTTFLERAIPINSAFAYNPELISEKFGGLPISQDTLDAAREAYIQKRANAKQDSQSVPEAEDDEDFKEENDIFKDSTENSPVTPEPVDESGSSPTTVKTNQSFDKIVNSLKSKYPENWREKLKEFILNKARLIYGNKTRNYTELMETLNGLFDGTISKTDAMDKITEMGKALNKELEARKANQTSTVGVEDQIKKLREIYTYATKYVNTIPVTPSTSTTTSASTTTTPTTTAAPSEPVSTKTNADQVKEQNQIDGLVSEANKVLDAKVQERLVNLLSYATPFRANAVEVNKENQVNTDPFAVRNTEILNTVAGLENSKARLSNNKFFIIHFLLTKFPDKTYEQAVEDFNKIASVFENSILEKDAWLTLGDDQKDLILKDVNELLGDQFFDQATINYYFNVRGEKLSKNPSIVITALDEDDNLVLNQGYPLNLNLVSRTEEDFTVAGRILNDLSKIGYTKEDVVKYHDTTLRQVNALEKKLMQDDEFYLMTPFKISSGITLDSEEKLGNQLKDTELDRASINDFQLIKSSTDELFEKKIKAEVGRLYYRNGQNPVLLRNDLIRLEEAQALAKIIFNPKLERFEYAEDLKEYLEQLINQISKTNRLHFNVTKGSGFNSPFPVNVVKTYIGTDGKKKNQRINTEEELVAELIKQYYKTDSKLLSANANIKRFQMTPEGVVVSIDQPYLLYIKSTHKFPSVDDKVASPVNKVMYLDTEYLEKAIPSTSLPKPVSVPSTPTAPVPSSDSVKETVGQVNPVASTNQSQGLNDINSKIAEIEKRRQEEFDRKSPGNSIIAADYLFTGGKDVMLSTDYLLQALTGAYPAATKALNNIRAKYGSKIGNIKDDIGGEVYNSMMEEIREAIKQNYTNPRAEEIFNKILENATGFTYREGNSISSELEEINEENDKQINAKYDAEVAALESSSNQAISSMVPKVADTTKKVLDFEGAIKALEFLGRPADVTRLQDLGPEAYAVLVNSFLSGDSKPEKIFYKKTLSGEKVEGPRSIITEYDGSIQAKNATLIVSLGDKKFIVLYPTDPLLANLPATNLIGFDSAESLGNYQVADIEGNVLNNTQAVEKAIEAAEEEDIEFFDATQSPAEDGEEVVTKQPMSLAAKLNAAELASAEENIPEPIRNIDDESIEEAMKITEHCSTKRRLK